MKLRPRWPAPEGCRECAVGKRDHVRRFWPGPPWHLFVEPTQAQILERVRGRFVDAGELDAGQHILVVSVNADGEREYDVECPGVSKHCRMWQDCHWCKGLDYDQRNPDGLAVVVAHDDVHQYIDERWMVPTERCYLAYHDDLPEAAEYLDLAPGRYAVDHDSGDGTELNLFLLEETSCPA